MTRTKIIAALCTTGLALGAGSAEAKPFHGHGHRVGVGTCFTIYLRSCAKRPGCDWRVANIG